LSNKVCYWFKAGKSFNDRLINAFAVQFSKSIFVERFISYHVRYLRVKKFFIESRFLFSYFVVVLGDK
ncbi:hypothetical protein, partial [Brevibacillus porteri]|uniref:hypothetical protein n=1 Tax=Brevibacillus porteri TaxID=2126350 RepID=UPI003645656E